MAAYYNEIDPFAAQWLRNLIKEGHIAPGDVDERSIEDVSPHDLKGYKQCHFFAGIGVWSYALRQAGWDDDREVWSGSCPCQPYSSAGKRKGFADERHLWPAFFHLIRECKPQIVIGEQVASKDGLAWIDLVYSDLEGENYACAAVDLCAAGVGAPHIRQRLYWAGVSHEYRPDTRGLVDADGTGRSAAGRDAIPNRRRATDDSLGGSEDDFGRMGTGDSGTTNGFWSNPDWIKCRDNKWRPVRPGTQPLVSGAPARMGRLRAYGNAIVAPLAKTFVEAVMESLPVE